MVKSYTYIQVYPYTIEELYYLLVYLDRFKFYKRFEIYINQLHR